MPLAARFEPFGGQHLVLLTIFVAGLAAVVWWGRRHRGTDGEERARRGFAVVVATTGLGMMAYQLTPGDFALGTSLPLQLCDLATVAAVLALWNRSGRWSAFTYYVGLSLTIQGVLTPSLAEQFPHPRFFGFWALHFLVIWAAVYLVWGLGLRPTWGRYAFSLAVTGGWAAVAFGVNVALGTNYGYLNRKPPAASLLDLLGPWPVYVVLEVLLVATGWALLLTWPWYAAGRRGSGGPPDGR